MAENNSAWGGRFEAKTAKIVEAMNASIAFDRALVYEDIAGSIAHARMLESVSLLSADDRVAIEDGLVAIANEVRTNTFQFRIDREDVHMNVEGALADRIGQAAGRLHTGRSRNDQVALDLRLWLRRELTILGHELSEVVNLLIDVAQDHAAVPMPGYTHMQRAQPITFGHHIMAYVAMFLRDIDRLLDCRTRVAVMPLGSGALAGSPLPLDRQRVAKELEFSEITLNSLDAVSDRDPALETLSVLSILMVHISRMAEEFVIWNTQEFGFVEFADTFSTGSSLMPQKKNPDIPELLRGKSGRVFGALQALLTVMKGLPLAYNKDMQEDKEPLFDAMKTARQCVGILPELLKSMILKPKRLKDALRDGYLLATDVADYLVNKGVPFREAHGIVGRLVALGLSEKRRLGEFSLEELREVDERFDESYFEALDIERSLSRRKLHGGPAPSAVATSARLAWRHAAGLTRQLEAGGPSALERALWIGAELPAPVPSDKAAT